MAFDDLARHMAARDGKKMAQAQPASIDQFMAEAADADRRMNRKRDLILGPILLVGGLVMLTLFAFYLMDALDPTPNPQRPPSGNSFLVPTGATVAAAGMVIVGLLQTIRGIRGRSR
jgi:hypothetical protein